MDPALCGILIGAACLAGGTGLMALWQWWRGRPPALPEVGDCPPMPPVKPPKEPREAWHFPAGMNYSTCAKAMKVETLSLEAVVDACKELPELLTLSVIITTKAGLDVLTAALPPRPKTPPWTPFNSAPFWGIPMKEYAEEGLARAAAIVAEADGYEVMLFLPDKGWEVREDAVGQAPPYEGDKANSAVQTKV